MQVLGAVLDHYKLKIEFANEISIISENLAP
jgi:hypothetical protein